MLGEAMANRPVQYIQNRRFEAIALPVGLKSMDRPQCVIYYRYRAGLHSSDEYPTSDLINDQRYVPTRYLPGWF